MKYQQLFSLRPAFAMLCLIGVARGAAEPASVNWLDGAPPATSMGITLGVPWPQGQVQKNQAFTLTGADGNAMPLQTWPTGYWPDGSVKWIGAATVAGPETAGPMKISVAPVAVASGPTLKVTHTSDAVTIDTGKLVCKINKQGPNLVESMAIDGREVATHGQLECIDQVGPETDHLNLPKRELYVSEVLKVTVEQSGPVRAVVKIEGQHKAADGARRWLPFVVRMYFYAGETPVKLVHTIIFDGDQNKDFIRGLGLVFDVPMREQAQNRHVRFGNSNGGLWGEAMLQSNGFGGGRGGGGGFGRGGPATQPGRGDQQAAAPATQPDQGGGFGGFGRGGGPNQQNGERLPNSDTPGEFAQWDSFKLVQPNSEGFKIIKRTNADSSWIDVAEGSRASGYAFVGDVSGGIGVSVQNFWQSYPASLEILDGLAQAAKLHVWLWSPDAAGMDMRHYDTHGHGNVNGGGSYEDYEPEFADPVGVVRTSDLTLYPTGNVPTRVESVNQSKAGELPPVLTVAPQYLHSAGVFGIWSLPDTSTPFKKEIEDHLTSALEYYKGAIDEHHWYGYWNFGDVRHAYDAGRHEWRYDVGGYAWDNSELGSVLWLWYSYVRTGRPDIYRMATAMTRHNSEVDMYHLGKFAGLGSRHNVSHWGDSAKEARVSQAAHHRFMYFLTTDERLGDVLDLVANVDEVQSTLDTMRKAFPPNEAEKQFPGRVRVGPDWLAFAGNWMIAWERSGDTKWRDKIMAGVNSMANMDFWMRSGWNLVLGYDYKTGQLFQVKNQPAPGRGGRGGGGGRGFGGGGGPTPEQIQAQVDRFNASKFNPDPGSYNLPTIQGGGEVGMELTTLLNDPTWTKMWSQYCRLGAANAETLLKDKQTGNEGADASLVGEQGGGNAQGTARLSAFAYYMTKNPAFAQRAIRGMEYGGVNYQTRKIDGPDALNPVEEVGNASTNTAAQSSLMDIEILQLCADQLPQDAPPPADRGFGGRGGGGRGGRGGGTGGGGNAQGTPPAANQ